MFFRLHKTQISTTASLISSAWGHLHAFLRRPWVISRALGCGARRGARLYTTAQVWVQGGLRGACSGHSKSRNLANVITGLLSAELEPIKTMENPLCQLFLSTAVKGSSTTTTMLQAFLGLTATVRTLPTMRVRVLCRVSS